MSAACYPRSRSNPLPWLILLCCLALMIVASLHALKTHGTAAITAQNCFNGHGTVMRQTMIDPLTNRKMSFCMMSGHWFISIDADDGGNVTMFPRSMAKCLQDVMEYAWRSGFTRVIK